MKDGIVEYPENFAAPEDIPTVSDIAYDATTWNGNADAPSKNAVRDKIETMPQLKGISFRAAKGTNQTSLTTAMTKITFTSETFDTNGDFASSTFTASVAGKYRFSASVGFFDVTVGTLCWVQIYVNGAYVSGKTMDSYGATYFNIEHTDSFDLGVGDTVEVYASGDAAWNCWATAGSHFEGELVDEN